MAENFTTNDQLNSTLDAIDNKIVALAKCKSNHIKFDLLQDADMNVYDDLTMYKRILLNKLLGCTCLADQKLIKIISKIKKLTR